MKLIWKIPLQNFVVYIEYTKGKRNFTVLFCKNSCNGNQNNVIQSSRILDIYSPFISYTD